MLEFSVCVYVYNLYVFNNLREKENIFKKVSSRRY